MKNFLSSIFNFGDISQNNTILMNTTIDTQLNQIQRTFSEGKISVAFNDISSAKQEHTLNKKAIYHLIMLETKFYFTLINLDKVYGNLEYVEKELSEYLDISFYELKVNIAAINKDRNEFDNIIQKIKNEFNSNKNSQEYFDMIFLSHSGNFDEARLLYEKLKSHNPIESKNIDFIGGMIYSNLYFSSNQQKFIEKSEQIFTKLLSKNEADIFDKLSMHLSFSSYVVNQKFNGKDIDNYEDRIKQNKDILNLIINDINYFGIDRQNSLKNNYLHCLWLLNSKNLFIEKYKLMKDEDVDNINFYIYNFHFSDDKINYPKIEKRMLVDKKMLIFCLDTITEINSKYVLTFISKNKKYLNDEMVLNIYIKAQILVHKNVDTESIDLLEKYKNNSLMSFLTYLDIQSIKNNKIDNELLDKLLEYFDGNIVHNITLLRAMRLLSDNNRPKDFIALSLKYQDSNKLIVQDTLKLILEDKNVYLIDFEKYLEKINGIKYSIAIANIYMKYGIFTKAYSFYKTAWENLEFENNYKINFAHTVLQNCSIQSFIKTKGSIISKEQDNIYLSFLENNIDTLSIGECFALSYYRIVVEKSYDAGFRYINKELLKINIGNLTSLEKDMMSSLYFYTLTNINQKDLLVESNIIVKNGEEYCLSNTLITDIHKKYNFSLLSDVKFQLLLQKSNIEKISIFHYICGEFIYSMDNKNIIKIEGTPEDPIGNLKKIIIQQANKTKDILLKYSEGNYISFYQMAGKYESYFELIPKLYESNTIIFDTGNNNKLEDIKKILTLSSIIFIDYMGKLDIILQRNDIYIQQTTVDFLLEFIKDLDGKTEIFTVNSDGENLFKNIADEDDIGRSKDYLIYLATKITEYDKIINDRETVLVLAASEEVLVPHIGYQEYRALAYSVNHNYQIITEDRIIKTMFEQLHYSTNMVSNSVFLLVDDISDNIDLLIPFYEKLHSKKYKHILNESITKNMFQEFIFEKPIYLLREYPSKLLKCIVSIAYSYGWMDGFEDYYQNNYEFKMGMSKTPKKDFISSNIEYLREESNYFNEDDFPQQAISGLTQANKEAILSDKKVYVSENGFIYEKSGRNEKKYIKRTNEKISVDISKKIMLG